MRNLCLAAALALLLANVATAETIRGQYIEARNACTWAGPCLYNAEVRLTGNVALLAWKVEQGSFQQVALDGLSIVAVVEGNQTFGIGEEVRSQTVFIVDPRATDQQCQALMNMAKQLAGNTIQEVVRVKREPIRMTIGDGASRGFAIVDAGTARLRTRPVREGDHSCASDRLAYPLLAKASDESAAFTVQHEYRGGDLSVKTLECNNVLSGVTARFAL